VSSIDFYVFQQSRDGLKRLAGVQYLRRRQPHARGANRTDHTSQATSRTTRTTSRPASAALRQWRTSVSSIDPRLAAILSQAARAGGVPVVLLTRKSKPLWLVLPFAPENSHWLQGDHSRHTHRFVRAPNPPHWTVPKAWLNDLARRLVARFGSCYLV